MPNQLTLNKILLGALASRNRMVHKDQLKRDKVFT